MNSGMKFIMRCCAGSVVVTGVNFCMKYMVMHIRMGRT